MLNVVRVAGLALAMCLPGWQEAGAADFYAGKTIIVSAGLPAGGGVDGEMRVLTRFFANHIPGHPTIVNKNTPGAGGIILANYMANVAPADGLNLGMPGRSGFLLSNVVTQKAVNYDITKFSYVGSGGSAINALWVSKRTGITSVAELKASKKEIVIGALSPRSENAIAPRVLAVDEHWPLKVVTGYAGFQEVLLAVDRGEVDGLFTNEGSIANTRPDMIASGTLRPIVQSAAYFPNVPTLPEVISDPTALALLNLVTTPGHIGLPLLGPPGIPQDRLDILRTSYAALMEDPEYRAEAERRGLPVGRAVGGAELQKLIAERLKGAAPDVVKSYLEFTGIQADKE